MKEHGGWVECKKLEEKWIHNGVCLISPLILKKPVNFEKNSISSFIVFMQWFEKILGKFKFKYDHADCKWIDVDTIISIVTMSYNPTQKAYTLGHVDAESLHDVVSTKN